MRPTLTASCLLIGAACRETFSAPREEAFDPTEVAGLYVLNQVDGHAIGWYHDLGTVDCQAAFINGQLELATNGQFDLDLDFNIRCFGTDPFDGTGRINVYGSRMRKEGDLVLLTGLGPNFVDP